MNPKSYRILTKPISTRVRCPICHEEVYSRAGIHPQCAVRQCDPPRVKSKGKPFTLDADPLLDAPGLAGVDPVMDVPVVEILSAPGLIPV